MWPLVQMKGNKCLEGKWEWNAHTRWHIHAKSGEEMHNSVQT